jgi:hypothetical protein
VLLTGFEVVARIVCRRLADPAGEVICEAASDADGESDCGARRGGVGRASRT